MPVERQIELALTKAFSQLFSCKTMSATKSHTAARRKVKETQAQGGQFGRLFCFNLGTVFFCGIDWPFSDCLVFSLFFSIGNNFLFFRFFSFLFSFLFFWEKERQTTKSCSLNICVDFLFAFAEQAVMVRFRTLAISQLVTRPRVPCTDHCGGF